MENQITVEQKAQIEKILTAHNEVQSLDALSEDNGRKAIQAAITAGKILVEARRDYGQHGKWLPWLSENCKLISHDTAERYMKLSKSAHVRKVKEATSLRQAYLAAGIIKAASPKKARTTGTTTASTGTTPNGATQTPAGATGTAPAATPSPAAPVANKLALSELVEMVMAHLNNLNHESEINAATEAIAPCGMWYIQQQGRLGEIAVLPIAA